MPKDKGPIEELAQGVKASVFAFIFFILLLIIICVCIDCYLSRCGSFQLRASWIPIIFIFFLVIMIIVLTMCATKVVHTIKCMDR